jgi:hypothetical protein
MIIDFHTHAFPDTLAARALNSLTGNSGMSPCYDGTAAGLTAYMAENGVDRSVMLSIATNAAQQQKVNDFAASVNNVNGIIGFGSVFPFAEDAFIELERIKSLGLKGIKLHPDYQNFYVDDAALFALYDFIGQLGLVTVFHMGYDIGLPEPLHASPERLKNVLPYFKNAPVVAAHFGGYMQWYEVEEHLVGKNCYLDTSYTAGRIPFPQAKRIVQRHGAGQILFGSDTPWSGQSMEKEHIQRMGLSDDETEKILGLNAERILDL